MPDPILTALRALPPPTRAQFLETLPSKSLLALPHLWPVWAREDTQLPPPGDWQTWLILGGRGSGKTRAGAEWVRAQVEGSTPLAPGPRSRIALLAETADQARDVMVLGESGLLACTPRDRRPTFHVSRRHLEWPNGAQAWLFSAADPESLRGPQFDGAWCDELAKWRKAAPAWDMLQFGLRLGADPRQIVTTTPRANPVLLRIMEDAATITTRSPTRDNAANLAPAFLTRMQARYAGNRLGRQELDGELLLETPGALWTRDMLDGNRTDHTPPLARVVVAVDPPVTSRTTSDACGIVVAALIADPQAEAPRAVVLADWSVQGRSPRAWAMRAVAAYHQYKADRLVAEVNQGGDMVEQIIREIDGTIAFRAVRATRGKALRAEPVAALYEQGRVLHLSHPSSPLATLEDQMCAFAANATGGALPGATRSPDRVDALVWAITDLLLTKRAEPKVRIL